MGHHIDATFSGRIGSEPKLRRTQDGKPWLAFSVAVGNRETPQWVQCRLFGDTVLGVAAWLCKGTTVYVEGGLTLGGWTDASGQHRATLEVAATLVAHSRPVGRAPGKHRKPRKSRAKADYARPLQTAQRPAGSIAVDGNRADDAVPF